MPVLKKDHYYLIKSKDVKHSKFGLAQFTGMVTYHANTSSPFLEQYREYALDFADPNTLFEFYEPFAKEQIPSHLKVLYLSEEIIEEIQPEFLENIDSLICLLYQHHQKLPIATFLTHSKEHVRNLSKILSNEKN